jgi:hypothetical protein
VEAAFAKVRETASGGRHRDQDHAADGQDTPLEMSEQERKDMVATAKGELMRGETTLITGFDPDTALRIFGKRLVRRAHQLEQGFRSSLMTNEHR